MRMRMRMRMRMTPRMLTNVSASNVAAGIEVDPDELPESRGVVILDGLGVAEGLEDGVGLQQLLLKFSLEK